MTDYSSALIFHGAFGSSKRYSRPNKACTLLTRTDSCSTVELRLELQDHGCWWQDPAGGRTIDEDTSALVGEQLEKGKTGDWAKRITAEDSSLRNNLA
ncbi:hypothetical protein AC578_10478 [Pseudocercospora eumusae]|uniref:Uncharacterized protein n=1 Tax=Pseudocercospora eumusae TaxID=321146 RepID=A0A139GYV1_9PEZI|nr:hypothetical protein AC578_10478 [Pseudocercospora eumusae]